MRYQEAHEKMPSALFFYEGVTQEEIDKVTVSKFEIESEDTPGIFTLGTTLPVEALAEKQLVQSVNMRFG
jgi:hypothetical protein